MNDGVNDFVNDISRGLTFGALGSLNLQSVCLMSHLGLMALLGAQTRSWSVKLLGYNTQKLSLVLCSVAVRRTNVHHLEKSGGTDTERYTKERGTEAV